MKLARIETPGISHFAWLIADGIDAALVDPRRDVDEYLAVARDMGVQIRYVIETHRQEDFVMGAAWLARLTGAKIVNGTHELFGHGDLRLADGESFNLGSLTVRALHTPGHTLESMCYAVYREQDKDSAWCVLTGDALFFGTTGRTDLPDAAKAVENAALLYDSIHQKLATLGDSALVLPAHGPGSVCGSGMAELPYSTIGGEKRYNEVFTLSRDAFARKKGGERLPRPPYFRHMEKVNLKGGLAPGIDPACVRLLDADAFANQSKGKLIFDTREPEGFAGGHVNGSYSIWLKGLAVFGGWTGTADTPVYLLTDRDADIEAATRYLTRIGIDTICAGLAQGFGAWRKSGQPVDTSGTITPRQLHAGRAAFQVLDVRDSDEFDAGHIDGASHMYVGELEHRLAELDLNAEAPVVVTCGVGHRASLGVSILLRHGYHDVRNLLGGMTAWRKLQYPVVEGSPD